MLLCYDNYSASQDRKMNMENKSNAAARRKSKLEKRAQLYWRLAANLYNQTDRQVRCCLSSSLDTSRLHGGSHDPDSRSNFSQIANHKYMGERN